MIKVNCHTNIDCAKYLKWPTELPDRPMVGDLIRSTSSTNRRYIELQVVRVTWVNSDVSDCYYVGWKLDVELHLVPSRFSTIDDFERHVKYTLEGK